MEKDYAVAPGRMLDEWLDENDMTQTELARRLGCSVKHVNQVVNGVAALSPTFALELEQVTRVSARLWSNMEANYRIDMARLVRQANEDEALAFLRTMPVSEMRKRGILTPVRLVKQNIMVAYEEVLGFFQVASAEAYHEVYGTRIAAYRQSGANAQDPNSLATWLRLGELAAQRRDAGEYDPIRLAESLPTLRGLTVAADLTAAVDSAKVMLAECGVKLVIIDDVPGTRLYGATRWINKHPVVQLSLRRKKDDHFWFSFFHELGHVLRHKNDDFIDYDGLTSPRETEANTFAADLLIPASMADELPRLRSLDQVTDFAKRASVAPGVVVGRLQHDKHWTHGAGNSLKRDMNLPLD